MVLVNFLKTRLLLLGLASGLGLAFFVASACSREPQSMILATTTSTYDSGILDYLLPKFEKDNNVKVKVVSVGTGQAIALGQRGDADVILVHDRAREDKFVADGYGVNRKDVMYNDFVIVGPERDPAGIKGTKEASKAFAGIAQAKAAFVSRGDESGTHGKEKTIWNAAGVNPTPAMPWYLSAGQGMGETLTLANEKGAYTLADRGTFLSYKGKLSLTILVEGAQGLLNPYGVIAVNPQKFPKAKHDLALKLTEYLTSVDTQKRIAEYGKDKYGQSLFFPDSEKWKAAKR